MEDDFDDISEVELNELLIKCEGMLQGKGELYLDPYQFEAVLDFYLDSGDTDYAQLLSSIASRQHPRHLGIALMRARVHVRMTEYDLAMKIIKYIEQIESSNADARILEAVILLIQGFADQAEAIFKSVLSEAMGQEVADRHLRIGRACVDAGLHDEAVLHLEAAYLLEPDNIDVVNELGFAFVQAEQYEKSNIYYQKTVELDPFSDHAWYELSANWELLEEFEKAVEAADFAIAINPEFISAYHVKGQSLIRLGRFELAVETYKELLDKNKSDYQTYYNLGLCYEEQEQYDDALKCYWKVLDSEKLLPESWFRIGEVKLMQDKPAEALPFIDRAIEIDDDQAQFHHARANALAGVQADWSLVESAFKRSLDLDPETPIFWGSYSFAASVYGMSNEAVRLLDLAILRFPTSAELFYQRSGVLADVDPERALFDFAHAVTIDPSKARILIENANFPDDLRIAFERVLALSQS